MTCSKYRTTALCGSSTNERPDSDCDRMQHAVTQCPDCGIASVSIHPECETFAAPGVSSQGIHARRRGDGAHQHRLLNAAHRTALVEQRAERRPDAVRAVTGLGVECRSTPLRGRGCTCTTRSVFMNVHFRMSSLVPMPLASSATVNSRCRGVMVSPLTRSTVGFSHDSPGPSAIGVVNHRQSRLWT